MAKLTKEDCPNINQERIDKVNALTDEQLIYEIEAGRESCFRESMRPALKLALKKREDVQENEKRTEELDLVRSANEIAQQALAQSKIANQKSDKARFWAAIAVLVTVIIAAIGWL